MHTGAWETDENIETQWGGESEGGIKTEREGGLRQRGRERLTLRGRESEGGIKTEGEKGREGLSQ